MSGNYTIYKDLTKRIVTGVTVLLSDWCQNVLLSIHVKFIIQADLAQKDSIRE